MANPGVKTDGGAAFPLLYANGEYDAGMSLRDYFAAWAIGMPVGRDQDNADPAAVARAAYAIADAMLAEREKRDGRE